MKTLLLIYSKELSFNTLFLKQLLSQLQSIAINPNIILNLKDNSALLDTLVWTQECNLQRFIAICDDEYFTQLNSALSTIYQKNLEKHANDLIIQDAQITANCASFKIDKTNYFLIKQQDFAELSQEVLNNLLLDEELKSIKAQGYLLNIDSQSASVLLSPAASASNLTLQISQISDGVSQININANEYSDVSGFFHSAKALLEERLIVNDNIFAQLIKTLCERKLKLASAESCTAGMFLALCASIEGASKVLVGGFCSYSKASKKAWLNVNSLQDAAVYSQACAQELAYGALCKASANIGIGITGVLGKDADCGVDRGTVQICACNDKGDVLFERINLNASRLLMQEQASIAAAALCLKLLER